MKWSQEKSNRNNIYKYVSKSTPYMKVYTSVLLKMQPNAVKDIKPRLEELFEYSADEEDDISLGDNPFESIFDSGESRDPLFSPDETEDLF